MDEWGIPPRPHELGGRWGSRGVVQTYLAGQVWNTLTFSDFKTCFLCRPSFQLQPCPDPVQQSEECFSKHPLSLVTINHPLVGDSLVKLAYQLLLNITCSHCVLRWRYNTNHGHPASVGEDAASFEKEIKELETLR